MSAYEREWPEETVTIRGTLTDKEWVRQTDKEKKMLYVQIQYIEGSENFADAAGKQILCYLAEGEELPKIGSTIQITGKVRNFRKATVPGQFDARSYYSISGYSFQCNQTTIQFQSGQFNTVREALFHLQKRCSSILDETLPEEDASLMKTMLLGEKSVLSDEIKSLYQKNGIAHVLAISGLHVSLIGMTLYRLLKKLSLPGILCGGAPACIMVLYGLMTGFSVSSLRAILMFSLHMGAVLCKRTYDLITAVFVAAAVVVIRQPLSFYSSSFLFSFGCVFSIGFLVPALTKERPDRKQKSTAMQSFLSGAALTASSLPLQMAFFYQVPVYATFLNLLVIPLMSFLLPCGILLLPLYGWLGISMPFAAVISGILGVYETACRMLEKLPFSMLITGKPASVLIVLYVAVLFILVLKKKRWTLKRRWMVLLIAMFILIHGSGSFYQSTLSRLLGMEKLEIAFLDVGQGDCIVIEAPTGETFVVDCGSTSEQEVGRYRLIPYLKYRGISRLSGVIVTHTDEDHISGIRELLTRKDSDGITVDALLLPDIAEESRGEAYEALTELAREQNVPVTTISRGMHLMRGDLTVTCLHPESGFATEEANACSTVLLLSYLDSTVLLTGDIEEEGETLLKETLSFLPKEQRDVDVLKVAHHGSRYTTDADFLSLVRPECSVISCGENNSYGHPHAETLYRLEEADSVWYCTKDYGTITVSCGRNGLRVGGYLADELPADEIWTEK